MGIGIFYIASLDVIEHDCIGDSDFTRIPGVRVCNDLFILVTKFTSSSSESSSSVIIFTSPISANFFPLFLLLLLPLCPRPPVYFHRVSPFFTMIFPFLSLSTILISMRSFCCYPHPPFSDLFFFFFSCFIILITMY